MKYLIACLGNIGAEYANTRHNIGFMVADHLAKDLKCTFTTTRLAMVSEMKYKGRQLIVIKPTTYMNLSGKAVKYWATQEKIPIENILVVCDDLALPTGTLRMKKKGSDGGHNGLKNIIEALGSSEFCRLRIGIGNDYAKGKQIDYVIGEWKQSEIDEIQPRLDVAVEMIKSFVAIGPDLTMNQFNNK
ncbi:MAG: aminoacyl-tRNA hydrolase [Bacteroidales bacterium]|nr:aminoacyl-tRNA hydrolase [Bacteroidales bacterium]